MAKERIIWSGDINIDDWKDFLEEAGLANADEDKQYEAVYRMNNDYFDDERINLNVEIPGNVLAIADLGLWYGRRSGYRELGSNVNEIFNVEASKYYCDTYDVRGTFHHHDGTNEYLFRYVPDGVDATPLLNALYDGKATHEMVLRYTRSLRPYVSKVYGWGGRQPKSVA